MNETRHAEKGIYKVLIRAPIDRVWSELINTASPRPFFWNSFWDTKAMAAGNAYRMRSNNGKTVGVVGEIIEIDPPRRLVTSFKLTAHDDPLSRVIYTLEETSEGTEFTLITEKVLSGSKSEKAMADGSRFIVTNFKAFIETGKVTLGARFMLAVYKLMAPLAPKAMRAENWPLERRFNSGENHDA